MARDGGYAAIWRQLYDDQDPFHPKNTHQGATIREAFTDCILRASYTEREGLERGQFRASVRQLADAWNVPRMRAKRYLDEMVRLGRVEVVQEGTNRPSVWGLPNYSEYQPPFGTQTGTANGTADGTPPGRDNQRLTEDPGTASGTANGTQTGTPTSINKKKKTENGGSSEEKKRVVRACWEAWKELNADWWTVAHMKLTAKRRKKLGQLYDEQLRPRADEHDPVELFRQIIQAARRHDWWGTDRGKVKPETLFRNTERREERMLDALDNPRKLLPHEKTLVD